MIFQFHLFHKRTTETALNKWLDQFLLLKQQKNRNYGKKKIVGKVR